MNEPVAEIVPNTQPSPSPRCESWRGYGDMSRRNGVFEGMYHYNVSPNRTYDVTSDGRFIMVALPDPSSNRARSPSS